jgi:hypothetical protein
MFGIVRPLHLILRDGRTGTVLKDEVLTNEQVERIPRSRHDLIIKYP